MIIHSIKRRPGIAGQFQIDADITYHEPDTPDYRCTVSFVGSVYGGPVVMISAGGHQVFVGEPNRFGSEFGVKWVRRFFENLEERNLVY